jgi:hypothetical protein
LLLLIVNVNAEKSGLPKMAAINGVKMSFTSALITAPNAAPITTATARSTTFPRMTNSLNSTTMLLESSAITRTSSQSCAARLRHGEGGYATTIGVREGRSQRKTG